MFCPSCGKENRDDAAYCDGCGRQLSGLGSDYERSTSPYQPAYHGAQYGPATQRTIPDVPSHLGWAIVSLILFFWPTAIPAIVYANRVGNKLAMGDVVGAQEASGKAKTWCWVSTGIAILWVVIVIIAVVAAGGRY
jgi:hypothetical protein